MSAFILILATTLITACGGSPKSFPNIFNGIPIDNPSQAGASQTVALVKDKKIFCSGFLIAPHLVVTAAHCLVDDEQKPDSAPIEVYFGSGRPGGQVNPQARVLRWGIHKDHGKIALSVGLHDTAYLLIDLPGPNITTPMVSFQQLSQVIYPGAPFVMMGFGLRGAEESQGFGEKFLMQGVITNYTVNEFQFRGGHQDACAGDSGGPVFAPTEKGFRLIGLVSRGDGPSCVGRKRMPDGSDGPEASTTHISLMHDNICDLLRQAKLDSMMDDDFCYDTSIEYAPAELSKNNFLSICRNPARTEAQTSTLRVLSQLPPNGEDRKTGSCLEVYRYLRGLSRISLRAKFITDLSPLLGLDSLRQLDLGQNRLRHLEALSYLKHIESVTMDFDASRLAFYAKYKRQNPKVQFNFEWDLASLYGSLGYEALQTKPLSWFDDFVAIGLAPEQMLAPLIDGDHREAIVHLLGKMTGVEDDYLKELLLEYAEQRDDHQIKGLL